VRIEKVSDFQHLHLDTPPAPISSGPDLSESPHLPETNSCIWTTEGCHEKGLECKVQVVRTGGCTEMEVVMETFLEKEA
jgi:hypothetical protein